MTRRTTAFTKLNPVSFLAVFAILSAPALVAQVAEQDLVKKAVVDEGKNADIPERTFKNGYLIEFTGPINRFQNELFKRKLNRAKKQGADLVVVEINSPGGTVEDSLEIATRLRDVDWAYTVAFIPEKALSGAALASLGCDEIIMQPTGRIGDAGVIFLDDDFLFKYAPEKPRSDIVRQGRDLATAKGRSPDLVEAMIDMDVLVFQKNEPGKIEFTQRRAKPIEGKEKQFEAQKELDLDLWTLVPESNKGKFLVLNGPRAVELEFAQGTVVGRDELAGRLGLTNDFVVLKREFSDSLAYILNRPFITVLLLGAGVIALLFELSAPGISVGGIISALCFGMFFWARFLGGTAGALELVMFAMGIVFILMELFVIPGFGITGLLGLFLLVSSLVLASQDFVVPTNSRQVSVMTTGLLSMLAVGAVSIAGGFIVTRYMGSMPLFNKLMLEPPTESELSSSESKPKSDFAKPDHFPSVGQWGEAESVLRPAGKAKFGGETFDVVAYGYVDKGTQVKVVEISGRVIHVSSES